MYKHFIIAFRYKDNHFSHTQHSFVRKCANKREIMNYEL